MVRRSAGTEGGPGVCRPAFVGRDRELAVLLGAARARPSVVLIEGEAGIGKSRLVVEAVAVLRDDGVRVLVGTCHPLREPLAFGPVVDALRGVGPVPPGDGGGLGASGVLPAELLAAPTPGAPPWPAGHAAPRHLVARGVRALLESVGPVVLVVEDVQWADEATQELLLLLGRDLPADTALVLSYRGEDLADGSRILGTAFRRPPGTGGAEIVLRRLSAADLRLMARSVLGEAAAPALLGILVQRSEGLPLVMEEDLLTVTAGAGEPVLGVPRSLREIFAERVDRLPPDAVALVNAAAVLTVPASERLLADCAALAPDAAEDALTAALAGSVVRELGPDRYGFAHLLAMQAHYDNLPGPLRRQLHERALEVLQALPVPPLVRIAHHARALSDTEGWLRHAMAAVDQAVAVGDQGTAAALLNEILEEPELPVELHTRAALTLARIAWDATEYTRTIATLRRIVAGPGLPTATRGEIRLDLGLVLLNQAADPSGETEIERAVEELEGERPEQAARAMSLLAMWETSRFSAAEQRAWLERAEATIAGSPDRAARASVTANRITVLGAQGRPEAAGLLAELPRTDEDPEVVRHTARALANAAEIGICLGQDALAAQCCREALVLARRHHAHALVVHCRSYELLLSWCAGAWTDWDTRYAAFLADYVDEPLAVDDLLATAEGITAAARGRAARAVERFTRVLARDRGRTNVNAMGAAAGLARLHLQRGDLDTAWRTVDDYLGLLPAKEEWVYAMGLVPTAVEIALRRGEHQAATDLAAAHRAGVEGLDAPGAVAEQHLCRALLAEAEQPAVAAEEFDRARAQWTGIGRPYAAALAAEQAAAALVGTRPAEAAARLTEAAVVHDRLGAVSDAARCRHLLRGAGQQRPPSRGRAGYGDELSPRELEVARLLVDGTTNRDIAAALFLSPRTVEHHVAKVLRKLRTTRDGMRSVEL
ncbi:ATP-binding protein [Kitasatospora sp. NPDC058965]|uniref:ATP-binding protein n=1 Tax=Kitasatospora sp. NPDC058965 TaxID=3346682 RepID=UPI00368E9A48